ncbi:MAG: DUF3540 domain-containing protein [Hyphomicrobiales bacterium]
MSDPAFGELSCLPVLPEILQAAIVQIRACGSVCGIVLHDGRVIEARVSPGCLLRPETGDTVAVCLEENGRQAMIFAVLERAEANASHLDFDHGVRIVAAGSLSLIADRGLKIRSRRLNAFAAGVKARLGNAVHHMGKMRVMFGCFRHVAERVQCASARVTQRLGSYARDSLAHEERHAASSRHVVETDLVIKTRRTDIVAKKTVKCDAKLIQLG